MIMPTIRIAAIAQQPRNMDSPRLFRTPKIKKEKKKKKEEAIIYSSNHTKIIFADIVD